MWGKKRDHCRNVAMGLMNLARFVFDFAESPEAVTEGCVRG